MKRLILHVGMPKTGTTSIQQSLFWSDLKAPFRFVSLDTNFANRLVSLAYRRYTDHQGNFFLDTLSSKRFERNLRFSKKYIHNALSQCSQQRLTPIFSAETLWGACAEDLASFRNEANSYGFSPQITCYLRAPIDFVQSAFVQRIKTGKMGTIESVFSRITRLASDIRFLDDAFGSENVRLFLFDPKAYPENCIVKHFCDQNGLDSSQLKIVRENESININRLRFLYAWNTYNVKNPLSISTRLKRRLVLDSLQGLSGPRLRFHPNLTKNMVVEIESQLEFLEKRLGLAFPMSLSNGVPLEGIERDEDLWDFTDESLDWLWASSYARSRADRPTNISSQAVVERLNRFDRSFYFSRIARYVNDELRLFLRRKKLIRQNVAKA